MNNFDMAAYLRKGGINGRSVINEDVDTKSIDREALSKDFTYLDDKFEEERMYGVPDLDVITGLLEAGDLEVAVDEFVYAYSDQDGGEGAAGVLDMMYESAKEKFENYTLGAIKEDGSNETLLDFNGQKVRYSSIEVDGVDSGDYPDFADAFISYAEYEDGTELTYDELDAFYDEYNGIASEMALDTLTENKRNGRIFKRVKLIKEDRAPGFTTRGQGEPLPTLEGIQAAYEAKNKVKEDEVYDGEYFGGIDELFAYIRDNNIDPSDALEAIGQEFGINFEFGAGHGRM